jgi:KilA-N domain
MSKNRSIEIKGVSITISAINDQDYISLTDMVKGFEDGLSSIERWLRGKDTIEFMGVWELYNNPNFNSLEFEGIKNEAGTNRFSLSAKKWIQKTNAVGITAKTGRYGSGTYAPFKKFIKPICDSNNPSLSKAANCSCVCVPFVTPKLQTPAALPSCKSLGVSPILATC